MCNYLNILKKANLIKPIIVIIGWLLIASPNTLAQYTQQRLNKSQEINTSNYDKIKGSPYLYENFMYASFFDKEGVQYRSEFLNYNGYEQAFEVLREGKLYNFKVNQYDSIVVHPTKTDSLDVYEMFVRGAIPESRSLTNVIYYGPQVKLSRQFKVRIEVKTTETPGQTIKNERFAATSFYKLLHNGQTSSVRLKKSDLTGKLGHKAELLNYARKEKLSFTDIEDVKKILAYYEQITGN